MEADQFNDAWLDVASDRILATPTVGEAVTLCASYLTDLFDTLASIRGEEIPDAEYQGFICDQVALIDNTPGADDEGQSVLWELARTVLILHEKMPIWTEEKLQQEAFLCFGEMIPPEKPLNDGIRTVLGSILAYHQGWLAGEALK